MRRLALLLAVAAAAGACGPAGGQSTRQSPSPVVSGASGSPSPFTSPWPGGPSPAAPSPAPVRPSPAPPVASPSPWQPFLPPALTGTEWYRLPTARRIVALTFDGGSGAQGLPKILAALAAAGVPGTFFLTGRWVEQHPDGARQIAAVPMHSIGNHSYDHPHFTQLTNAQIDSEIARCQSDIQGTTGRNPKPIFRFPYGDSDARTVAEVNRLGYGSIRWTVDTLGWEGASSGRSTATIRSRVLASLQPGEIVLMHIGAADDGTTLDADALPSVIADLRARGYGFVAVWDFVEGLG